MLWITRDPPGQWGWYVSFLVFLCLISIIFLMGIGLSLFFFFFNMIDCDLSIHNHQSVCFFLRSLLFPCSNCISDGTVAIFCSLILFLLPKDPPSCNSWALSSIISCFWFSSSPRSVATSYETLSNISVHNDLLGDDASSSSTRDIELRPMSSISLSSSSEQDTRHASPNGERVGGTILDWRVIKSLQWDIIFLLGGGFALSKGFQVFRFKNIMFYLNKCRILYVLRNLVFLISYPMD